MKYASLEFVTHENLFHSPCTFGVFGCTIYGNIDFCPQTKASRLKGGFFSAFYLDPSRIHSQPEITMTASIIQGKTIHSPMMPESSRKNPKPCMMRISYFGHFKPVLYQTPCQGMGKDK